MPVKLVPGRAQLSTSLPSTGSPLKPKTTGFGDCKFRIAIANGIALGIVGALGTYVVLGDPQLSLVFAMALVINSLVAGLVGVIVPVTLDKARIDPAVSSAVFVTTVTDVMGFFSFLGLAALLLIR